MPKKAEPSRPGPSEKVRVRRIDNGFLVTRAGVTPRGKVYHREEYSAEKPGSAKVAAPSVKSKPREVGFLKGKQ